MVEKVKVTKAQAIAIKKYWETCNRNIKIFLEQHSHTGTPWEGVYAPMNDLSQYDMARALLIGYEVGKLQCVFERLGRKYGEFHDGDMGGKSSGTVWSYEKSDLERWWKSGELEGFYPKESFVRFVPKFSLEGGEES